MSRTDQLGDLHRFRHHRARPASRGGALARAAGPGTQDRRNVTPASRAWVCPVAAHPRVRPALPALILAVATLAVLASCTAAPAPPVRSAPATHAPARPMAPAAASPVISSPFRRGLTAVVEPWRLPAALSREVVLADHRRLVVVGGLTAAGSSTAIVQIDPATGTAARAGELARPVHDAAGVTLGGRDLVFGGGTQASVAAVQEFGTGGSAVVVGRLPRPRSDLVAAVAGSTAYILAGYDGSTPDPAVLATTDGRHFTVVAGLPVPVRYPAVAVLGHDLYLFGGEHAGSATTAIQRVDTHARTAALVGHLPHPLAHATAVTLAGTVYLLGGVTGTSARTGIARYDPAGDSIVPAGRLPYPVSDAGAAVLDGTAYLLGGENPRPLATVVALHVR